MSASNESKSKEEKVPQKRGGAPPSSSVGGNHKQKPGHSDNQRKGGNNSSKTESKRGNSTAGTASASRGSNQKPPRLALFDHLPQPRCMQKENTIQPDASIHPAIHKLGALFASGIVYDDDDRAETLLIAFCNVIEDYKTPPRTTLSWDLDKHIKLQVHYLVSSCRPHSMAMGNIIKYLRFAISQVSPDLSEADAKALLIGKLRHFHTERVVFSRENICTRCCEGIRDGEVVLTFGSSPLLRSVLSTVRKNKNVRVIIVDSLPRWEGLRTLQLLTSSSSDEDLAGCVYAPLAGAASAMREATRVILGASALLSNGSVIAPAGTAMVAALAHSRGVPVIFAAESFKFTEKVQMDSIVYNELGDPADLLKPCESGDGVYVPRERGDGFRSAESASPLPYQVLNLKYDVTPIRNVSAIVTEVGKVPPTSIPVLLRELKYESSDGDGGGH